MGSFSLVHWVVLAVVAILLLGGGRFSNMMGDVAKGIKQFKKGMAEEDEAPRLDAKKSAEPVFDRDGNPIRDGVREER